MCGKNYIPNAFSRHMYGTKECKFGLPDFKVEGGLFTHAF